MTLDLQQVARAMRAAGAPRPVKVTGWSVDTRTQNPGDLYFALRGPHHDGHNFIAAAIEKGAAAVVVESVRASLGCTRRSLMPPELVVRDTERALQDLAAWARKK